MPQNDLYIRIGVKDAEQAKAALRSFGTDGQKALNNLERATRKPSKSLLRLDSHVKGTRVSLQRMGQTASILDGPLGGIASRFSGLSTLISGAGIAMAGFALAGAAAVAGLGKSIAAANEYEKSMFKIEAVLNTTGFASGKTAAEINELSIAIGKGTLASVGGVREAAAQLLTFKNISGDAFDRTLIAAQDLAALGFGTVGSSAVQLAKALEDPATGLTMLRRVGVSFTQSQQDMIKAMQEAGDVAGAQAIILAVVEGQVAGAGSAQAGGLAGAYDTLTENVGLFLEGVGNSGPIQIMTAALSGMSNILSDLNDSVFPPLNQRIANLKAEITDLQIEIEQPGRLTDIEATGILHFETTVEDKNADLLQRREQLAKLIAEQESQQAQKRLAEKAAADRQYEAALEANLLREIKARDKHTKEMETAIKKEAKARISATEKALSEIERLEDQAAKASLDPIAFVDRERTKSLDHYRDLEQKKLITANQFGRAEFAIQETWLEKRKAAEKEFVKLQYDQREQTFGGAAQNQIYDYFGAIDSAGSRTGKFITGAFGDVEGSLTQFFSGAKVSGADFLDSMKSGLARLAAQDVISGIGGALGLGGSSSGSGSIIGTVLKEGVGFIKDLFFADGGRVEGPGTGTSDSIIARVSNGEYVVNAGATARHLPLLEAINDNRVPGFAKGGRVGADGLLGFAFGGINSGDDARGTASQRGAGNAGYGAFGGGDLSGGPGDFDGLYTPDTDHIYNVFDQYGNIVDRFGGGFLDRIATFFGSGQDSGFLGSRAAGIGGTLVSALLGGLPGLLLGSSIDLGREIGTGGLARNGYGGGGTGAMGLVYDLISGRQSFDQLVDNTLNKFNSFAGSFGGGSQSLFSDRDAGFGGGNNGFAGLDGLPSQNQVYASFAGFGGGAFDKFRGDLAGQYRNVELTGAQILRGYRRGGRPAIGQEVLVGESGPEPFVADLPGTILSNAKALERSQSPDLSELVDLQRESNDNQAQMMNIMANQQRQISALVSAYGQSARLRKTARA